MNLQVQTRDPEPQPAFNPDDYADFDPRAFEGGAQPIARSPMDMMGDLPPPPPLDVAAYEAEHGRISRNAQCPCGSGKKFKHCHGKLV